jgi:dihydropteroate synthase
MLRRRFEWKLKARTLLLGERTLVMGVLNVTPDSFSDGGRYHDPDRAFARAMELEDEGADLIDIGAESTRPGSDRISEAEEMRRLVPVLKRLQGRLSIPVSVDTYKSAVAEKAIGLGAEIINDPSSLTFDPMLAKTVAQFDAGFIVNHMRGTPETWAKLPPMVDPLGTIAADLDACVHRAVRAGVERTRVVVDPGLGFGKRREQNSEIIARLPLLSRLELPILIGPSRKQFLAQWEKSPDTTKLDFATAGAVTAAILGGAHIVRVHDVRDLKPVVQLADQILSFSGSEDSSESPASRGQSGGSPSRRPRTTPLPSRRPGDVPGSFPSVPPRPRNPK